MTQVQYWVICTARIHEKFQTILLLCTKLVISLQCMHFLLQIFSSIWIFHNYIYTAIPLHRTCHNCNIYRTQGRVLYSVATSFGALCYQSSCHIFFHHANIFKSVAAKIGLRRCTQVITSRPRIPLMQAQRGHVPYTSGTLVCDTFPPQTGVTF